MALAGWPDLSAQKPGDWRIQPPVKTKICSSQSPLLLQSPPTDKSEPSPGAPGAQRQLPKSLTANPGPARPGPKSHTTDVVPGEAREATVSSSPAEAPSHHEKGTGGLWEKAGSLRSGSLTSNVFQEFEGTLASSAPAPSREHLLQILASGHWLPARCCLHSPALQCPIAGQQLRGARATRPSRLGYPHPRSRSPA